MQQQVPVAAGDVIKEKQTTRPKHRGRHGVGKVTRWGREPKIYAEPSLPGRSWEIDGRVASLVLPGTPGYRELDPPRRRKEEKSY